MLVVRLLSVLAHGHRRRRHRRPDLHPPCHSNRHIFRRRVTCARSNQRSHRARLAKLCWTGLHILHLQHPLEEVVNSKGQGPQRQ